MDSLRQRYNEILSRMEQAALRAKRDSKDITLVCVSKKQSVESMKALEAIYAENATAPVFGENYVQEIKAKRPELDAQSKIHLIGPLQSNKVKEAVALCDTIESVHSEKILKIINHEAEKLGKVQSIYLQVNISQDVQKSGFLESDLSRVLPILPQLSFLSLKGLMTITQWYDKAELARPDFAKMFEVRRKLIINFPEY
ncbi:MAG: alanine racemase, partial [Bdellovibrionales bacterium]|nr:alanine racemase [Bdellovibrionales bacterium]